MSYQYVPNGQGVPSSQVSSQANGGPDQQEPASQVEEAGIAGAKQRRGAGKPTKNGAPALSAAAMEGGKDGDGVNLERKVGLLSGVALIVGTMIGSGIFVSPKGVLEKTGSVGLSLLVWAGCGLLSLFGALSYAEVGTVISGSGGEHAYFLETFAPEVKEYESDEIKKKYARKHMKYRGTSFIRPLPAYLYGWLSILLLKPSSLAIIALTFSQYFIRLFSTGCNYYMSPEIAEKLIAACCILMITFINSYSVTLATKVQNLFTAAKLIAVVIIVIGGITKLIQGNTQYLATGFEGTNTDAGAIALSFYSGLWAYDGWNNLNYVTEELKKPYTTLPRAIKIGIPLVTICYILVNVSYLAVMSKDELLASETVAVLFGGRLFGVPGEVLMIVAVAMSTFGAANGSAFTGARLCFVAAREGHMVDVLSYVHVNKKTPSTALIFNAFIALLMVIPSDIESLIDFFSFTAWIFYGGAMVALLVLRKTRPDAYRPYKVFIGIPILVLCVAVYLVVAPLVDDPQVQHLYATLFIVAGVVFYFPFVHYRMVLPGMGHLTTFVQLLFEVVPTDVIPDP